MTNDRETWWMFKWNNHVGSVAILPRRRLAIGTTISFTDPDPGIKDIC